MRGRKVPGPVSAHPAQTNLLMDSLNESSQGHRSALFSSHTTFKNKRGESRQRAFKAWRWLGTSYKAASSSPSSLSEKRRSNSLITSQKKTRPHRNQYYIFGNYQPSNENEVPDRPRLPRRPPTPDGPRCSGRRQGRRRIRSSE